MQLFKPRKSNVKIVMHHRNSTVYQQGRYLVVETRASVNSKKGRQIIRETAEAMLEAISAEGPLAQERPKPPVSFGDGQGGSSLSKNATGHVVDVD